MAKIVDVKGVGKVEFPDNTPRETMLQALRRRFTNAGARAVGATEALGSIGSGIVAEPVAGLAGVAGAILPGEQGQGAQWVDKTRQALTFNPRTATGQARLQDAGEALSPIGEVIEGASQTLGDKTMAATDSPLLSAIAYTAPTALLEGLGVKGLRTATAPVSKADLYSARMGAGMIDDDLVTVTHATSDPDFKGEIRKGGLGNIFDGVFASYGDSSRYGGVKDIKYEIPKSKIMSSGDSDVDYDSAMAFIRDKFDDLPEDDIETIYAVIAEDKNIFDLGVNPFESYGYSDLGEASWFGQKLRGELAKKLGFDAVEMSDEYGTSILIPYGSGAKVKQ